MKSGEYYDVQIAINGVLSPAMEIHASAREQYPREADFISYLTRSAETMIQLYGDARVPQAAMSPEELMMAGANA